jgi:hypothetical protein
MLTVVFGELCMQEIVASIHLGWPGAVISHARSFKGLEERLRRTPADLVILDAASIGARVASQDCCKNETV